MFKNFFIIHLPFIKEDVKTEQKIKREELLSDPLYWVYWLEKANLSHLDRDLIFQFLALPELSYLPNGVSLFTFSLTTPCIRADPVPLNNYR